AGFQSGGYWTGTAWLQKPVYMLLQEGSYTTVAGLTCGSKAPGAMFPDPGGDYTWAGNNYTQYFCYIGPAAMADTVAAYGHNSGLFLFGKMRPMGNVPINADITGYPADFFGVSVRGAPDRAMACCPTLQVVFGGNWAAEPHYGFEQTATDRQGGESWSLRRRNYVYADGHAAFMRLNRHP
ncbi:MAG: hypothetical protein IT440_15950, partial [Phycisphaeraceae bacterium]|nr:hypothetical protein [Phycisphaeraceae bacterium]